MSISPDVYVYRQPQHVIPVLTHRIRSASSESVGTLTLVASVGDNPDPMANKEYFRTSLSHGRAIYRELEPNSYIWDENGLLSTVHSIKGIILTDILDPEQDPPPPETPSEALLALWPRGLNEQIDEANVSNVILASSAFRSHGLITEYALSVSTMDSIVINGKTVNLHDQLSKLAAHRRKWLTAHPLMKNAKEDVLEKMLDRYEMTMKSAGLYVIERYLPVAERLEDIFSAQTIEEVLRRLQPSRHWTMVQRHTHPEFAEFPDIMTRTDLQRYFRDWLPAQMGRYLGRIHRADTVHGGTHAQNWMPIGALADCESARGKLVSNNSPTEEETQKDIQDAFSVFLQMNDNAIIREIFDDQYNPNVLWEIFHQSYLRV